MTSEISGELILVLEMLVTDFTASAYHKQHSNLNPSQHIKICLDKLTHFTDTIHLTAMTKILPFICYEHTEAIDYLINFFKPHL